MLSPLIASPLLAIIWLFGGWVRYFNAPQPVYFSSLVLKPPHRSLGVSKASSRAIWPLCCVCKDKCYKPKGQFRLLTPHLFIPRQLVPHYLCCTICFLVQISNRATFFLAKCGFHTYSIPPNQLFSTYGGARCSTIPQNGRESKSHDNTRGIKHHFCRQAREFLSISHLDGFRHYAPETVAITFPPILTHGKEPHLRLSNLNFFRPTHRCGSSFYGSRIFSYAYHCTHHRAIAKFTTQPEKCNPKVCRETSPFQSRIGTTPSSTLRFVNHPLPKVPEELLP